MDYTSFPSGLGFYGGITQAYGTGLHEDYDPTIGMSEPFRADYLNLVEHRIDDLEHIVNQVEHFILYPNGHINEALTRTSPPASGTYYHSSNYSILASGINRLIQLLGEAGTITTTSITDYPFSTGSM
jgi:hypothetical protein